ncbi:DUF6455 family protein [Sagittula sp. SSi028]|uniref:DUF6455 family protein n=1 Tax=Sagittula sp. SSi028 TaxID=3400636 RepID=UPI003AF8FACF
MNRPHPLGPVRRHFWLIQRMAKACGIDLTDATRSGALSQQTWAGMVTRCRGCRWAAECDTWLAQSNDVQAVPAPCVNKSALDVLRGRQDRRK